MVGPVSVLRRARYEIYIAWEPGRRSNFLLQSACTYMSGPMRKPPLWKRYIFSDNRIILYRTVAKSLFSEIMLHKIKIHHASNCIPFSKYCKIAILANVITVQAYNITVSEMP